ncbi:MAG: MerR family transcriptional regulator [Lachnospiraceae bacterium]|nr:MerR family transcriptional regulator [Lachnospiraceae bacterium]
MKHDLFSIGEVARLFHISISTLRYYDKEELVKPEYTDAETGYRYYSTQQFEALNTIRYLRALNAPLPQIREFLQNRQIDTIQTLLLRQRNEIIAHQEELRKMQRKIDNRIAQIEDAVTAQLDVIALRRFGPRKIALLKRSFGTPEMGSLELYIRQLEENDQNTAIFLGKIGIGLAQKTLEEHSYQTYDLIFLLLDEEDQHTGNTAWLPEETCLVLRFRGSHESAPAQYQKMMSYIEEHSYRVCGFSKEITLIDYGFTNDQSEFVTEIQIPVEDLSAPLP